VDIDASLNKILQARDQVGSMFYEHLLSQYPEIQRHFKGVDLKRQSVLLTTALMIIERHFAHPTPALEQYLQYLGSRHHGLQVPREVYTVWLQAMLETLQRFHGDDWTQTLESQWRKAFEGAIELMFDGYGAHIIV
jgi:hemoglobin-like flavoprotein